MSNTKGRILYNEKGWEALDSFFKEMKIRQVFVIVDEHTEIHCLPLFISRTSKEAVYEVIKIPAGEKHKNISTTLYLWECLGKKGADKSSVIVNLGGGMVTDIGGFVASTYKRGIRFIHIPTTLLAMVDASIGGKTGIDLDHIKNQIGTIQLPEMTLVDTDFLFTLSGDQLLSGMAEVIKHALIKGKTEWEKIKEMKTPEIASVAALVPSSIAIKEEVVVQDPDEKGLRKVLNYGHTLGHAIEAYSLRTPGSIPLLHGDAVAIGMILESYISTELLGFPKHRLEELTSLILKLFPKQPFDDGAIASIIKLTSFDKKNVNGEVRFVLMEELGKFQTDCTVPVELIYRAFSYYQRA
ncbi:MAG TPA: 3-dehydroquinate synthase [Flavobacteriaceae bacterium]|nr:3-dehydroquinate synthase [Flavobacteriaceae bacterium]